MFCAKCGNELVDTATVCPKCGVPVQGTKEGTPMVSDNLVLVILSFLCCFPFGIPAVVFNRNVYRKLMDGNIEGAKKDAKMAKVFGIIGISLGCTYLLIQIIVLIIKIATSD